MRRSWAAAVVTALAMGAAGLAGGPAAATVPAVGRLVGMISAPDGTALAGEPIMIATILDVEGSRDYVDIQETTTDADGTYGFDVAYATGYYVYIGQMVDNTSATRANWTGVYVARDGVTDCAWVAVPADGAEEGSVSCSTPIVTVERFWSQRFNNAHFFTTSRAEADHIKISDTNWQYENPAFDAVGAMPADYAGPETDYQPVGNGCLVTETSAVYRFYSPVFQSHFYTMDEAEKDHIVATDPKWTYEGIAYCALPEPTDGWVPLYRFWSPKFGKHFFTANKAEADHIRAVDTNWSYEGIAYYVLPRAA